MTVLTKKLTKAQVVFLEDYFENVLTSDFDFNTVEKPEFVERVSKMDFDDGCGRGVARVRVGKNLNELGLFADFDLHGTAELIYLSFSVKGAEVMWELMTKAAAEGRLQVPAKTDLK
jgi:hypothetical protein